MPNTYRNQDRRDILSSVTYSPRLAVEDMSDRIISVSPYNTPILSILSKLPRGAKPKSHKVQTRQRHEFDPYDHVSAVTMGATTGANYKAYALLTIDQLSRPDVKGQMFYYPQEKFYISATGQVVEVVMTPDASVKISEASGGQYFSAEIGLTGNTTTTTAPGKILVKNVQNTPLMTFATSTVVWLGRTIYEGQSVEGPSRIGGIIYDCNFVEQKESVLRATKDQYEWVKTNGTSPIFNDEQAETTKRHAANIEHTIVFGERSFEGYIDGKPMRHMQGLIPSIKTNITYFNPSAIMDYETLISNAMFEQWFRWGDSQSKTAICGDRFLYNFNLAFKDLRRTSSLDLSGGVKLALNSYTLSGRTITLVPSGMFRVGTEFENWCLIFDPKYAEYRTVTDHESWIFKLDNERMYTWVTEWQGTVSWHMEQSNSLLRTIGG
jgi:hypothetical protein